MDLLLVNSFVLEYDRASNGWKSLWNLPPSSGTMHLWHLTNIGHRHFPRQKSLHFYDFEAEWKCQGPVTPIVLDSGATKLIKFNRENAKSLFGCSIFDKSEHWENEKVEKTRTWSRSVWPILEHLEYGINIWRKTRNGHLYVLHSN